MKSVNFCGTLYDIRMKRDGGGRMQIDFGADAFEEMLQVLRFFKDNQISVAMALVPYEEVSPSESNSEESLEFPDTEPPPSPE